MKHVSYTEYARVLMTEFLDIEFRVSGSAGTFAVTTRPSGNRNLHSAVMLLCWILKKKPLTEVRTFRCYDIEF
jgi:hypothetical protein